MAIAPEDYQRHQKVAPRLQLHMMSKEMYRAIAMGVHHNPLQHRSKIIGQTHGPVEGSSPFETGTG